MYSNVWISVAAAAGLKQTEIIQELDSGFLLPAFAFFATVCVYNYQRVVKLYKKASYSVAGRNTWLNRHRKAIQYWAIIGAVISLSLLAFLNTESLILLIIGGTLSVFYVVKIIPTKNGFITLRDIPYVKIYLIGISWAILTVLLPITHHQGLGAIFQKTSFVLFIERLFFILAITIPFDTRDLKYDEAEKRTLPQIFGVKKSTRLALVLIIGGAVCSTILFYLNFYNELIWIAMLISFFYSGFLINRTKESKTELFYTGWLDGTINVQFILVLIAWLIGSF